MKRLLLAGLALLAMAGSAAAADLSPAPYYKAPVYAPPLYTWTGFYVGLNGGGGTEFEVRSTNSYNISGGMFGGTVGYHYQFGWAVIGAEGDIDWAGLKGSTANGCPAGCNTSDSWLSTAPRARRLRSRPLYALYYRAALQSAITPRPHSGYRAARQTPAGRLTPASNSPSPAGGVPRRNISMLRPPASSIAA